MCIDVAAVHIDDPRLLHQGLAFQQRQLNSVLPGLYLEREAPRAVRRHAFADARLHIHYSDGSPLDRRSPGRTANGSADRPVGDGGAWTRIDDRNALSASGNAQRRPDAKEKCQQRCQPSRTERVSIHDTLDLQNCNRGATNLTSSGIRIAETQSPAVTACGGTPARLMTLDVLIPTWNRARLLERALRSLLDAPVPGA